MTDIGVEAHLEMVRHDQATSVRAFVAAASNRPLRWQLTTVSRSGGGTSQVTQSGRTDGQADRPVSEVSISTGSEGTVVLIVFDGEREISRDQLDLASPSLSPANHSAD